MTDKHSLGRRGYLLLLFGILFFLSGCGEKPAAEAPGGYDVVDDRGRTIHFDAKPQHVYGNTLSLEEVLLDLLPPERIAAVSPPTLDPEYSLAADKAARVAGRVPAYPGPEPIAALQPDLIFAQLRARPETIATLEEMGFKVFCMEVPTNLDMVRKRLRQMSEAVGEPERGQALLAELDEKVAYVKSRTAGIPPEKRRVLLGFSSMGAFGHPDGLFHDICRQSGVINGASRIHMAYGSHLSDEQILQIDPDIMMFVDDGAANDYGGQIRDRVLGDPALQTAKAVKNRRFFFLKDRYRASNTQHMGDAILQIARNVYPEAFTESETAK